jgi:hypothetical protein
MRKVFVALAAVAALIDVAPAQNKIDVSGAWDLKIETPQQTITPTATLKADGEKVTGMIKSTRGEAPLTGTISGSDIKLVYVVNFQGNELTITLSGNVEQDSIKGTADFGGFASGPWSATRRKEPAAAGAPASGDAVNISGSWIFTVETDQGSGSPSFTFKQDGEKLAGTYKGMFGEAPIDGAVKGKEIKFSFKVSGGGMEGTMVYTGTIEKDTMKGSVKLGEAATGTWTAKRQ